MTSIHSEKTTNAKVVLLPPIIDKQYIPAADFHTLSPTDQILAAGHDHIWKVTVTPRKTPESGLCRVAIVSGANMRSGIVLQNEGRVPTTAPAPGLDDLRPCVFTVYGKGNQTFQVIDESDQMIYINTVVYYD